MRRLRPSVKLVEGNFYSLTKKKEEDIDELLLPDNK